MKLIILYDIDEWLMGQVDDANDNENERMMDDANDNEDDRNELVFDEDPTLNWAIVYEVTRVGEPIIYTRRKTSNERKQLSSGGITIGSSHASKKYPEGTIRRSAVSPLVGGYHNKCLQVYYHRDATGTKWAECARQKTWGIIGTVTFVRNAEGFKLQL
ncbi:hypothetical protein V8G54_023975 [Vigna mungo]|uniref:Uncharacterized protein n=1 Tax=Vigna mungo TaxID=3915 RepID=A0AAQ3RSS6_VIGMU